MCVQFLLLYFCNAECVDQHFFRDAIFTSVPYEETNHFLCTYSKYKRYYFVTV